jgi:hypothetical protein
MKDYKSLTCLEIKQILKKQKITGYSKLCKQELVKLVKKTLNNKKGGLPLNLLLVNLNQERKENEYDINARVKQGNIEMKTFTPKPAISNADIYNYISKRYDIPINIRGDIVLKLRKMRNLSSINNKYNTLNEELRNIQNTLTKSAKYEHITELNQVIDYIINQIRLSKQQQ